MNIMENPRNFWPDFGTPSVQVPKTLMVEQANFFNEMTKNVLVAKVRSRTGRALDEPTPQIFHEFDICVPSLGNYTFTLFSVRHDVSLYPVWLHFDLGDEDWGPVEAGQFEDLIKKILNDRKTIATISGLLAQI